MDDNCSQCEVLKAELNYKNILLRNLRTYLGEITWSHLTGEPIGAGECLDPYHTNGSITSMVYDRCPTCNKNKGGR